jgi:hypothetical protein
MLTTMKRLLIGTLCFSSLLLPIQATSVAVPNSTVPVVHRVLQAKEPMVNLLTASTYAVLAKAGITTVPQSVIIGDIGVSPIAASAMTGFAFTMDILGTFSMSDQVTGQCFGSDYGVPTPENLGSAVLDMGAAYTYAAGRPNPDASRLNLGGGALGGAFGGMTAPLTPGVYTFVSAVNIVDTLYFEGTGFAPGQGDTDVFIIQVTGNLVQAANKNVILTNGALASNIFWQISGFVSVGAGAHLEGTLLCKTAVTFITSSSLNGRILAQTAVTLQMVRINGPPIIIHSAEPSLAPSAEPSSAPSSAPSAEPSWAPSVSPAPSEHNGGCTTTPEAIVRRLQSTTLEERWFIEDPDFTQERLDLTLDFEINDYITGVGQVQYKLFDNTCDNAYDGSGLTDSKGSSFFSADGFGKHTIGIQVSVDSDEISTDTQVYSIGESDNQAIATIAFCLRLALHTPADVGDIEVNFLETIVTLVVDLTDGFEIGSVAVEPFLRCEKEAEEAYEVEGYICTEGDEPTNLEEIPIINQGDMVKICVRPVLEARNSYIRMRKIQSFTFALADSTIQQVAITNAAVASNGLTDMWCDPGYAICHFETILYAAFYRTPGTVTGAGIADMQFGGEPSEQSVTPKNRIRQLRNLQEDAGGAPADFGLQFSISNANNVGGSSGAAGKTLFAMAVALTSLTLIIL